jgi:hypothetical protein
LNLLLSISGGNFNMPAKNQDTDYYTIEVARDLPLAEQLRRANAQLCFDVNVREKLFLEDIQFRNGCKVLRYRFWRD